jgi:sugar lactone lactonase YvrE
MNRSLAILVTGALLLALLAAGAAVATSAHALTPNRLATFPAADWGTFAESMAADSHGNLIVSATDWGFSDETTADSNIGVLWQVTQSGHKRRLARLDVSPGGMMTGVALDEAGHVYAALFDFGDPQTLGSGVFRLGANGSLKKVVALPAGSWPNGIAIHDGRLFITDSSLGAVWRARLGGGTAKPTRPWIQSDLLAPGDPATDATVSGIGANGLAFRGDRLYVTDYDFGRIVRVPVLHKGSAGTPVVVAERAKLKTADGIAFDALGGLWITTNSGTTGAAPSGALYRLAPSGRLATLADDPGWLNYPTMPVFGTTASTKRTLFVENGAYYSWDDGTSPDIRALKVTKPGLPLR